MRIGNGFQEVSDILFEISGKGFVCVRDTVEDFKEESCSSRSQSHGKVEYSHDFTVRSKAVKRKGRATEGKLRGQGHKVGGL